MFNEPVIYKDWSISPRTAVSMSIADTTFDDNIFEDAKSFNPERWLPGATKLADGSSLENYLVSFLEGPKNVLGHVVKLCSCYECSPLIMYILAGLHGIMYNTCSHISTISIEIVQNGCFGCGDGA